jgi:hypothetical protein
MEGVEPKGNLIASILMLMLAEHKGLAKKGRVDKVGSPKKSDKEVSQEMKYNGSSGGDREGACLRNIFDNLRCVCMCVFLLCC